MKLENSKPNILLRRPRPYENEDLAGYILRLSQVNLEEVSEQFLIEDDS